MLITVICVFLATELPQGIMTVTTGMIGSEFRHHIYGNLGDLLDLLSLINSCMTFVIYCSMSRQYRAEFRRLFIPRKLRRMATQISRASTENNNTVQQTAISENPSVFVGSPKKSPKSPEMNRLNERSVQLSPASRKSSKFLTVDYRPNAECIILPKEMGAIKTKDSDISCLAESHSDTLL